jgi:hypothetical protein
MDTIVRTGRSGWRPEVNLDGINFGASPKALRSRSQCSFRYLFDVSQAL